MGKGLEEREGPGVTDRPGLVERYGTAVVLVLLLLAVHLT
jgi:hypothetical protein